VSYRILTLNQISARGLARLQGGPYQVSSEIERPHAILVRSADLHQLSIGADLRAVGRAGAGVNNIPVEEMSRRGIPVFNAPGANANAVKELVLAGLLLAARNLGAAWLFARGLGGDDAAIDAAAEKGKKAFVGFELPGKTLGVVGLGAIGVEVANAALALGMRVRGYDPQITVRRAWQLSANVEQAVSLEDLFASSDAVTVHVPLNDDTRGLLNRARLALLRKPGTVLNFARAEIADEEAVLAALDSGQLHAYVSDFPKRRLLDHPRVVTFPHLGASTLEAEDNCAMMVVDQVRDFLENGNIRNSVNYPEAVLPRLPNTTRLAIANRNIPNMVGQISTALASEAINIADLLNKSRGDYAYTLIDIDGAVTDKLIGRIRAIDGVLSAHRM
jgi:D-3-phosphoglycerate dehydrogenase / 2-oxoglutarate reductase